VTDYTIYTIAISLMRKQPQNVICGIYWCSPTKAQVEFELIKMYH